MKTFISLSLISFFLLFQSISIDGQDSITIQDLEKFCYPFSVENGQFQGEGGDILTKALAKSHITMLAENTGSKLEHQFTNVLITKLDQNNYKRMVLEIGGGSGTLINKKAKKSVLTEQSIRALNRQYLLEKKGRTFTPIFELRSIEGIQSLENAQNRGWSFLSLGVEHWSSYKMHIDELYNNLNKEHRRSYKKLYEETIAVLDEGYEKIQAHSSDEVFELIGLIKSSKSMTDFLDKALVDESNRATVEALKQSIDYYWMYGNKEYYKKNVWSAAEDKMKLSKDLKRDNFDFNKDKLFVKMWRNHLAKGMSSTGVYGIGNMLSEMASYHNKESLTICMISRFSKEGQEIKDRLQASDFFAKKYREFIQLGKKDDWVLVDLRPFVEEFFYSSSIQSDGFYKMFSRYDMIVIPKMDEKATANY